PPRADVHPWAGYLDLQRAVAAIQLRIRRVVAKKIVGSEVVRDLAQPLVEIVSVDRREAIGAVGERADRLDMCAAQLLIRIQGDSGGAAGFERHEPAWI